MRQALSVGMQIDDFRLEEHLHRGGMGSLWRVTRPGLDVPAVMKVPYLNDPGDPTAIVSFEVEQMVLPTLSGVHVPRYLGAGGFESQPYLAMEQLPGETLRARFEQAPLPADEVARIGAKIATALHDLHRQHVIHLDLKPSNIMFRVRPDGTQGEAVLVDFGLARHDQLPDLLAEEFRLPMGTGPYISPEQVLNLRNDPRSDLFALGVLLYHLTTGARPFGQPTTVSGLKRRLYRAPTPPRALRPDCPPWLQEIILHCLEVNPAQRYGSAAQVAFDLVHPDDVTLTARALRQVDDGMGTRMKRWFRSIGQQPVVQTVAQQLDAAPIVVAAVDLSQEWEALAEAVRAVVRRVIQHDSTARLACVAVLKTQRIGLDVMTDKDGRSLHVKRLIELRHWAKPLELPSDRLTCHVLEAPDVADAILDYARTNQVDQIVIGSRGTASLRRYLGSVSAKVVAEAACTVTVVKPPRSPIEPPASAAAPAAASDAS